MPTALRTYRLRSSRVHSDRKPAVEVQRVGKAEVDVEIDTDIVEKKLEEGRRRRRKRMKKLIMIKYNNSYLINIK